MIPDIQQIFASTAAAYGSWFYVGKYFAWTLYGTGVNDGTISVEAVSTPSNVFASQGASSNIGIQTNNTQNPAYQPLVSGWKPSSSYALNSYIIDYNSNIQQATTPGVSGTTVPTFATSGTTADNTVIWTYVAAQGSSNFNSALISSAFPAGVIICPTLSASANLSNTPTGYGTVLYRSPVGSPAQSSALYIPTPDLYIGYIRVVKTGGGSAATTIYIAGEVDS
jgi:hypothetical protein